MSLPKNANLVKWHTFLKDLGFINVGHEEIHGNMNTKLIYTIHEKSRTDGWKLRILWSENIPFTGFDSEETTYRISLTLKISKEFLRPIKEGYFVLDRNGKVLVGDEKLDNGKDIVEHQFDVCKSDELMIMPLNSYKRYRFENVVIDQCVEVEASEQKGHKIPQLLKLVKIFY